MKIHYICEYNYIGNGRDVSFSPAGISKMNYIIDVLSSYGLPLNVFSTSRTLVKGYFKKEKVISENKTFIYRNTFFAKGRLTKRLERWYSICQLIKYLLFTVKKQDFVVAYHERYYQPWISKISKFKRFKFIYEIEELYTVAANLSSKEVEKEKAGFYADAYIFSTQALNEIINIDNKPFVISHGAYTLQKKYDEHFNDEKIHVVYAGTFDKKKGGAIFAISAAEYLSEKYHLHICGFGNEQETQFVKDLIEKTSSNSRCEISFDGKKTGEEYVRFLQKCHIGLSTQNPDGEYNNTSFPSKILAYLSNGLQVVTIRIPVIENSGVGKYMHYYDSTDPRSIARAICDIDLSKVTNGCDILKKLDDQFRLDLPNIFEQKNDDN